MAASSLQLAPRGELGRFVRAIRVFSRDPDDAPYVKLPDGGVELVVRLRPSSSDVHVVGTRLHALRKPAAEVPQAVTVHFKPGGAYPFFGVPMSELTHRIVPLEALWGTEGVRLRDALAEAPTTATRLRLLEDALSARLRRGDVFEPASAHVVRRAVREMTGAVDQPRVEVLARALGLSARQLRRAFDDVVGVGPKAFARILRFQRAVSASGRAAAPDWGAIAAAAGYYDQAHLIGEFRTLTGTTPRALTRALLHAHTNTGESVSAP